MKKMENMSSFIKFLIEKKASISVEMCGILMLFAILIILGSDVGTLIKTQNSLDKMSYSLAGLIRERTYLYNGKMLTEDDIDDLYNIALILNEKTLNKELGLVVEAMEVNNKAQTKYSEFSRGKIECKFDRNIEELAKLSFVTKFDISSSAYKVTLCAENNNLFMPIKGVSLNRLEPIASSVVYGR